MLTPGSVLSTRPRPAHTDAAPSTRPRPHGRPSFQELVSYADAVLSRLEAAELPSPQKQEHPHHPQPSSLLTGPLPQP